MKLHRERLCEWKHPLMNSSLTAVPNQASSPGQPQPLLHPLVLPSVLVGVCEALDDSRRVNIWKIQCEFNESQLQSKPRDSAKSVGFHEVNGIDVRRLSELHTCSLARQDCRVPLGGEGLEYKTLKRILREQRGRLPIFQKWLSYFLLLWKLNMKSRMPHCAIT